MLLSRKYGFTLIEVLIAMAVIIILSTSAYVLLAPSKQLANARNQKRQAHINTLINAILQNSSDYGSVFSCVNGALPVISTRMATGTGNYDIGPCLVPAYLSSLPYDPNAPGAHYASTTDYDTAYSIIRDSQTGRITLSAPFAENGESISLTR